jgi:CHAD domain-containing protein
VAKEWEVPDLSADEPFASAARKIIKTKSDEMWSYAPGTIADEDIEYLHSMRVSSRRLRAAVDICAPCFPRKAYARYRDVISELTGALGSVRDADVMLDFLKRERKQVRAEERAGLDDLIALVRTRREEMRPQMIAYLAELEAGAFRQRFERFLAGGE